MGSTFDGGTIGRKPSCSSQLMWRSYWTESFSCHCEHKIHSASGFTPLSRLIPGKHRCRVRMRISRMWTAFHPDTNKEYGLDSLLIDDEGCAMQARAPPGVMKRLQQQLVEGKIYAVSDFTVSGRMKNFMVCRNELMLYMGAHTRVNEIGGDIIGYSIPSHSFEFVDFSDVPYRNGDRSLLTDIMGQIVYIGDIQRVQKLNPIRLVRFRTIEIRDLRGREQDVTLYGDLGCQFDVELVLDQGQEAPVVAVFAGICVEYYAGKGFIVRSTTASKCYLDLKIQEVQEFRASLCHPHTPIAHEPCKQENAIDPIQEILSTWRTIEQLKSLDPLKLQNTRFMCTATLKDIDCTNGCWYLGCFHCWQSISQDGTKFWCSKGCPKDPPPVLIYKLDAVVEDATGDMHFTIFGSQAQALIGVTAEELVEEIAGDDDKDAIHDEIVGLAGLPMEHTFQVAVKERNFVVKWVLKDEDVEQLQRIKNCTQDEVKMVVKEETELKGLGTANESEQLKVVVKEKPED